MDVSGLYANERGHDRYTLVENPDFHDRWLVCDGDMFNLGGSIKDAGSNAPCTLSRLPATEVQKAEALAQAGAEVFGPTQRQHPQ